MRPVPFSAHARHPYPVRVRPLVARARDLEEANREVSEEGRVFLAAEEEIWAIRRAGISVRALRADLERWTRHPDERVQVAMLRNERVFEGEEGGTRQEMVLRLYDRALEDAQAEGVCWTPLLDALAEGFWPRQEEGRQEVPGRRTSRVLTPEEVLAPWKPWLEAQGSARFLDPLRLFRSRACRRFVARHLGALEPEMLEVVAIHPVSWSALAENPAFHPGVLGWLTERALSALRRGAEEVEVVQAMEELRMRGGRLDPRFLHALLEVLEKMRGRAKGSRAELRDLSLKLLTRAEGLGEEEVERLYRVIRAATEHQQAYLNLLVLGPYSGPEIWRRILKDYPRGEVRSILSCHPLARRHAEVRPALLRSRSLDVLLPLLADAPRDELVSLFARVLSASPAEAARALSRLSPGQLGYLPETLLAPLLASPEPSIRLAAVRVVGRWREARDREESKPLRRRGG